MKRMLTPISLGLGIVMLVLAMMALQPSATTSAHNNSNGGDGGHNGSQSATGGGSLSQNYISNYADSGNGGGPTSNPTKDDPQQSDGSLQTVDTQGHIGEFCPLKHTDVNAEISGFLARVKVTQEFVNPSADKVEAIYVFPLPQNSAVDDMTLLVGGRTIKGLIKKREEAQKIYNDAKLAGHTAALLDQERPNIFTQSVANIPPNATVKVEISYIETLKYEAGAYEFVYPMVVGPRYIPGQPTGKQGGGWAPDTAQVPDASRITPPVAGVHYGVKGSRAGHDISLSVKLDAGVPIQELRSATHDVDVQNLNAHQAQVRLRSENEIPNKDFVLKYDVAGGKIEDALLVHSQPFASDRESRGGGAARSGNDGFFSFILQPLDRVKDEDASPRELIFVLDTSGSMSGYPIETAKKTMKKAIENMRPQDTFNLITFSGDTHILFPLPVMATSANISQATQFIERQRGGGGTEMMKAIRAALGDDAGRSNTCGPTEDCFESTRSSAVRVVCFMTDGYVGNDMQIIGEIQKHPEARVFSFGIGSAVNRFLLDGMAKAGRGEVEYVLQEKDAEPAAARFYERVHTPVLTDISIDWNGLPVSDVIPARPLDLFTAKPLVISGRYSGSANGKITLRGKRAGKAFAREIKVSLPASEASNEALSQLWARTRIDDLMSQDWQGMQQGNPKTAVRDEITQLGLDYRLMTQFTSFVAVEEQTVVEGGQTRTIQVPVEMPQGVSAEGVFGEASFDRLAQNGPAPMARQFSALRSVSPGNGRGAGVGGGVMGRVMSSPGYAGTVNVQAQSSEIASAVSKSDSKEKASRDRRELQTKLHPAVLAVFDCWKKSGGAGCTGLQQGKLKLQIFLVANTPAVQKQLQALGFVVAPARGLQARVNHLTGSLAIEKLPELVKIAGVQLVALQN